MDFLDDYIWRDEIDRQVYLDEIIDKINNGEEVDIDIDLNDADLEYLTSATGINFFR